MKGKIFCIDCGFCLPYHPKEWFMPPQYNVKSSCLHKKNAKLIITPIQEYYEYPLCVDKNKENDCRLFEKKIEKKIKKKIKKKKVKSIFKKLWDA